MIRVTTFKDKRIALFGLGISGLSAAKALQAGGASLVVWDENTERQQEARELGLEVVDLETTDWAIYEALILSPGVPLTNPEPHWTVKKAKAAAVPIIGDTEIFFLEFIERGQSDKLPDKVIVITGTNGKSTTTALITHLLKAAGETVSMGGNIGLGVLDMPDFGNGSCYVLEMSSYQIDLTPSIVPDASALLNITADHIDRHGTVEHYAEVKSMVFDLLDGDARAVISIDDEYCSSIAAKLETDAEVLFVASEGDLPRGARISDDGFVVFKDGKEFETIDLSNARSLRGRHNSQNAAFAYLLVSKVVGDPADLIAGFESFPGLEHRCQEVGKFVTISGDGKDNGSGDEKSILFVNDSKATNAEASATALSSFDEIYWIAGGRAKAGGIDGLQDHFKSVKKAFLIGEAAEDFGKTLAEAGVKFELSGDMGSAVKAAFAAARADIYSDKKSGVVGNEVAILLSPAAASFDQYPNFEMRGAGFCEAIALLDDGFLY